MPMREHVKYIVSVIYNKKDKEIAKFLRLKLKSYESSTG